MHLCMSPILCWAPGFKNESDLTPNQQQPSSRLMIWNLNWVYTGCPSLNALYAFVTWMKDLRYILTGKLWEERGQPERSVEGRRNEASPTMKGNSWRRSSQNKSPRIQFSRSWSKEKAYQQLDSVGKKISTLEKKKPKLGLTRHGFESHLST